MAYHIQLPQFEGPLELLLSLIEKQKLDVTRVSLAKITDQYLEYIATEGTISLDNLAWFLVIASRLILIKSKALLPTLTLNDEEEEEIEDLEFQLREYKKFKDASQKLKGMFDTAHALYAREVDIPLESVFYPPQNMQAQDIYDAFSRVLRDIPIFKVLEEKMIAEVVTIEEKIISLQAILQKRVEMSFEEMVSHAKDKVEVIVSFLAMLELVKQRIIHVDQDELFASIRMRQETQKNDAPEVIPPKTV